jgi:hypothetical protein
MMANYVDLSMPKSEALAGLALLRFAASELERPLTLEERKLVERLEFALEGKDRRKANRFANPGPKPKGKRMGYLDVRRSA